MYSWEGWGYSGLQVVRRIEGSSLGFNLFFCDFLGRIILGSNIACSVSISWMHSSADQTCLGILVYHMKHIKLHRPCYGILWIHSVRWILIHHVYVYTLPYLICSCSFLHKACYTWPSGLGVGQWVMSHVCKKKTSLLKQDTRSKLCILFKIMFIKSHTELELPENLRGSFLGLIHFWCWNCILEGTLRIEALSFEIWSSLPGVCLFLFYQEIR